MHAPRGRAAQAGGGDGHIEFCVFENNSATSLFGGGTYFGDGTVRLSVRGSSWRGNECRQRGSQVYSSSGAGFELTPTSITTAPGLIQSACDKEEHRRQHEKQQ